MLARERRITHHLERIALLLSAVASQLTDAQLPSLAPRRPRRGGATGATDRTVVEVDRSTA